MLWFQGITWLSDLIWLHNVPLSFCVRHGKFRKTSDVCFFLPLWMKDVTYHWTPVSASLRTSYFVNCGVLCSCSDHLMLDCLKHSLELLTGFRKQKHQGPDLSGLVSLIFLLIDPNGGLWSGFSLQQALSSELMFSSHSCSQSIGRRGSPWKGVRNCITISGENIQNKAGRWVAAGICRQSF